MNTVYKQALALALEALETFALWESEGDEQTPATKAITAQPLKLDAT